jgi:hypothetical protein
LAECDALSRSVLVVPLHAGLDPAGEGSRVFWLGDEVVGGGLPVGGKGAVVGRGGGLAGKEEAARREKKREGEEVDC